MTRKLILVASIIFFNLTACNSEDASSSSPTEMADMTKLSGDSGMDHSNHGEQSKTAKKDMKAMFGPDYVRGDIGHSFGEVMSIAEDGSFVTIDHGPIHGIDMGAMTMGFDVLDSANMRSIREGQNVEFLVKKMEDETYHVMSICTMSEGEKSCLQG